MLDIIPISLMIMATAVAGVFGYFVLEELSLSPLNETAAADYITGGQTTLKVFDSAFLFLTFMIIIGTVIAAFFVRTHPIFFVVGLILSIVFIFIGAILTNIYMEIVSVAVLQPSAEAMVNMTLLMQNLPLIIFIIIMLMFVALYAKFRSGRNVGGAI